jgi:RNA polymerase sigma factor (sigma-70 family)
MSTISFKDETSPPEKRSKEQDIALWKHFKQGDDEAFEALVKAYYPVLLQYGQRLVRDKDFAQDCLQDFFIDLWHRKQRLDDVQSVQAYLMLAYRRRLFREKERSPWFKFATDIQDEIGFEGQFNIETYMIENEIAHENLKKLQQHLSSLSKRQREAIYLRFNQALEYDEIARIMGINHQSAINLVYESLKLLRKNWFLVLLLAFFAFA